jgi:hypothetical protein
MAKGKQTMNQTLKIVHYGIQFYKIKRRKTDIQYSKKMNNNSSSKINYCTFCNSDKRT